MLSIYQTKSFMSAGGGGGGAEFFLVAFGEVGEGREADFESDLADGLF